MKLAIIFHRFGPYHKARLNATAKNFEVHAIEITKQDDYGWDLDKSNELYNSYSVTENIKGKEYTRKYINKNLYEILDGIKPSIVAIPGWAFSFSISALLWCLNNQVPAIVMSESNKFDFNRNVIKEFIKRKTVGLFDSALIGGAPHLEYMKRLGMPTEKIFKGYDVVDNNYFYNALKNKKNANSSYRAKYNLPENYFINSSRFVPKKNIPFLLEAYSSYKQKAGDKSWDLVIIGDGEDRPKIENKITELNLSSSVHLRGFIQYEELPFYYNHANALVHASTREQWGLVVNEAMASGLPVLVSNRCGSAAELVEEGKNGFTFDPYNLEELAQKMYEFSSGDINLNRMGQKSLEIIKEWGTDRFAENLLKAANSARMNYEKKNTNANRLFLKTVMRFI